jgi:hypothetical protein
VPEASTPGQKAATERPSEAQPAGAIVKSGFGQEGDYAWVTSVVRNDSDEAGQTLTVQYNLKDAGGCQPPRWMRMSASSWVRLTGG